MFKKSRSHLVANKRNPYALRVVLARCKIDVVFPRIGTVQGPNVTLGHSGACSEEEPMLEAAVLFFFFVCGEVLKYKLYSVLLSF